MAKLDHRGLATLGGVSLGEVFTIVVGNRAVDRLFKHRLRVVDFELGLEVSYVVVGEGAAVGAATGVGKGEALVDDFVTKATPVFCVSRL